MNLFRNLIWDLISQQMNHCSQTAVIDLNISKRNKVKYNNNNLGIF